jgi:mannose-6-phosphate isomerase-like protein (cupin superfamily)
MDQPVIAPFDPAREYFFEEGCFINECWNDASDPLASVARARLAPGRVTRWHALEGVTERYVVLSGSGVVEVGTLPPTPVGPGDVVVIPPGARQRIASGGIEDLVFLAICTPRFERAAYVTLD